MSVGLQANRMCTWYFCIQNYVLISNMVNIDKHNSHKQKFFGSSITFKNYKGVLRPKCLRTIGLNYE